MENLILVILILGFNGAIWTVIMMTIWQHGVWFRISLDQMDKRFTAQLSEYSNEIRTLKEQLKSAELALRGENLAVKSDLSFNYHKRLGELQNRVQILEKEFRRLENPAA